MNPKPERSEPRAARRTDASTRVRKLTEQVNMGPQGLRHPRMAPLFREFSPLGLSSAVRFVLGDQLLSPRVDLIERLSQVVGEDLVRVPFLGGEYGHFDEILLPLRVIAF